MASSQPHRSTDIRAAGGVLWREVGRAADLAPTGVGQIDTPRVEVALVHRPRYDDWSLPKGKLDRGEAPLVAAVREVAEETGRHGRLTRRLQTVRYDVGNRAKAVQYWSIRDVGAIGVGGIAVDTDEVDHLVWLPVEAAETRLTYDDDRGVLEAFARVPVTTSVVVLVRHARAGKRSDWPGDDDDRPLDTRGELQAAALAGELGCFGPTAIFAADRRRCVQTVEPLAHQLGVPVQTLPAVSDEAAVADAAGAVRAIESLAATTDVAVVCSQGTAVPGLLDDWLPTRVRSTIRSVITRKAAYWVIGTSHGIPVWVDRYDRPAV